MADIAVALRGLDPPLVEQVQVVFVTTDPAHDTPAVLGEWLDRFDADLPTPFIGLTGDQAAIDQAQLAAGVPLAEDDGKQHSALLLLYGSDDQAHVAFDAGNTAQGHRRRPAPGDRGGVRRGAPACWSSCSPCWQAWRSPGRRRRTSAAGWPGSDFDGRVTAVTPTLPGVTVRVLQFGDDLELVNSQWHRGAGARLRRRAVPADRSGRRLAQPAQPGDLHQPRPVRPGHAARRGRSAGPRRSGCRCRPSTHYVWHDHRTHWMTQGLLPPMVAADPGRSHTVFEWTVPLRYGDTDADVRRRAHLDTAAVAVAGLAAVRRRLALLAAAAGLFARSARPLGVLMAVGAAAALWHAGATPGAGGRRLLARRRDRGRPAAGARRCRRGHRLPTAPPRCGVMTAACVVDG